MVRLSLTLFSLLMISVSSLACSSNPATQMSAWSVTLTTSGGFTGRGIGNILITSDGKINYKPASTSDKTTQPCEGQLSDEELRVITETVNQSKSSTWAHTDLGAAAPDAFGYELELHTDAEKEGHKVIWYDNTQNQLPEDLKTFSDVVLGAHKAVKKKCR